VLEQGRGRSSIFRLFGYAGTGKTTLVKHLAEGVDGKVLFAAFTGKAACVMRSKGCYSASTIHSLIYKARESGEEMPSFELWNDAPASKAKLIIIDECSMVDAELARVLMSFGVPLLVLGDPAQLPPIQGGGFFTDAEPDAMLTEVHRQARDNPIIRLSMDIRAGNPLAEGQYGDTQVVRRAELDPKRVLGADQVLVGRNVTRKAYTGINGLSLRIEGLDKGFNDNAYKRAIVIHGAPYVSLRILHKYGVMGTTFGCPAIPTEVSDEIIPLVKNGSCFFIYYPSKKYLSQSTVLNSF